MDERRFLGRRALVTGGGSGIGLACARALAREGATVTICGRTDAKLTAAAASVGDGCRPVVADITDEAAVARAVDVAAGDDGALDVVVANAGGTTAAGPLPLVDGAAFSNDLDVNVLGTFFTIKHGAPVLARSGGGAVVAISSVAGHLTHRQMGPYSTAKAALEMLVRNAADELGDWSIRVNAVRPGLVPSEASAPLAGDPTTRADYLSQMPLRRLGTDADIAAAVLFLAGPDSSWITGQCLSVDGGHSLRRGPDLSSLIGVHHRTALTAAMGTEH